ncbi:uncharacterized protein [Amphiura filiformis]|uniref:uncharacterized protein n=1 Tax=Amphiura filiformis TaxID=82378 RepID=UPI003B219BA2
MEFVNAGKIYIGSFYHPPKSGSEPFDHLFDSLAKIMNKNNGSHTNILLCGDFNLPDINWDLGVTKVGSPRKKLHDGFLDFLTETGLTQLNRLITRPRSQNVLDLVCTTNPNIVNNIRVASGISDHDILIFEINLAPKRQNKCPHKVFNFKKADTENLKNILEQNSTEFFQSKPDTRTVNENWNMFKTFLLEAMEKSVPHHMSKGKPSHPWINHHIIKHMRKRDKLYSAARKSKSERLWSSYKKQRNHVTKLLCESYHHYMEEILGPSLDTSPKTFWSFIRSLRREAVGIPTLVVDGESFTSDKSKAEALNQQFSSVFTHEDLTSVPDKGPSPFSSIDDLDIELAGVIKQLAQLNTSKAGGPDSIPARLLHDYATEIGPMLHYIFRQSYATGQLPDDWRKAHVTGIYKKGTKSNPANYRPISLTCISCKIMEHIVLSHMSKHLSANDIIVDNQHGFREKKILRDANLSRQFMTGQNA